MSCLSSPFPATTLKRKPDRMLNQKRRGGLLGATSSSPLSKNSVAGPGRSGTTSAQSLTLGACLVWAFVASCATIVHVARDVSIRELRNSTAAVISDLESGERLTLTVNRRPVADILPHVEDRDPWVPAGELRRILQEAPADAGLLTDLADIRGAELDDA